MSFRSICHVTIAVVGAALSPVAFSQQPPAGYEAPEAKAAPQNASERFAVHGQVTFVEQLTAPFHDPYSGPNSLSPRHGAETFDVTLYLGARLWSGAEAWANPEIDQGFGLDNTLGAAGFPSGEAYKVGRNHPYWRLPRLFVRQTVDLMGNQSRLRPASISSAALRAPIDGCLP